MSLDKGTESTVIPLLPLNIGPIDHCLSLAQRYFYLSPSFSAPVPDLWNRATPRSSGPDDWIRQDDAQDQDTKQADLGKEKASKILRTLTIAGSCRLLLSCRFLEMC